MKLPNKVKIGGHWYKVVFPYRFIERVDINGHTDSDILEIKIANGDGYNQKLANSKVMELFFHEVLHAIDDVYNANQLEEATVKRLGQGLFQFLVDNGYLKDI